MPYLLKPIWKGGKNPDLKSRTWSKKPFQVHCVRLHSDMLFEIGIF